MRKILDTVIHLTVLIVGWIIRPRHPALRMISGGIALIAIAFAAGWILKIDAGIFQVEVNTTSGPPGTIIKLVVFLGISLTVIGALIVVAERYQQFGRRIVLVLEQRGLHNITDTAVATGVPASIEGRRDTILVDIRNTYVDGEIPAPEAALARVLSAISSISLRREGMDRSDIAMVYGGLMPVPFSFLTGMLLDDEGDVVVLDWDRFRKRWRPLDGPDDNQNLALVGMDAVAQGSPDAVLGVSVSYPIDVAAIHGTFGAIPFVELRLPDVSPTVHWSQDKQNRMAQSFLEALIQLEARQVQQIHLVIAAPNSVSFRLGQALDPRTLPPAIIYQYERSHQPPYPWGVKLPTHGQTQPTIVRR